MRRRRPLAVVAAVGLAVTAMLVVTTRPARPAVRFIYEPMTLTPSCGAPSTSGGYSVELKATNVSPGGNTVYIGGPSGDSTPVQAVTKITVPASGVLDQTVTLPAEQTAGIYSVTLIGDPRRAIGYFSVPCPTLTVQPTCGPADDGSGGHYALTVTGTGFGPPPAPPPPPATTAPATTAPIIQSAVSSDSTATAAAAGAAAAGAYLPVHIELDGTEVPGSPAQVNADGTISVLITPGRVQPGTHTLHAYQTTGDSSGSSVVVSFRDATTTFTVPCATTTTTQSTTTQSTTTQSTTTASTVSKTTTKTATTTTTRTTTTGTTTGPTALSLTPSCLPANTAGSGRVQVQGSGFAAGALEVLVDGRVATNASADSGGGFAAEVEVSAGSADHAIEARQGSRRADATLRVPCTTHPSLKVDPALGPPGFVTQASGSGFPPNTVVKLSWTIGIGSSMVRTDANGTFHAAVLIFPLDQTGARALRAAPVGKGGFPTVKAPFLCVPGTEQPRSFDVRR